MIKETAIPVMKRCGAYLRWYYNGWMYWHWLGMDMEHLTEGEEYRTTGTRAIQINSGPVTFDQITGIRTILNSTEVYLLTENGWRQVRLDRSSLVVKKLLFGGYDATIRVIIGSFISLFGNSPVIEIPIVPPDDLTGWLDCIGTQIWASKNYDSKFPGSRVYDDDEANRLIYGGLYSYAQVITPGFAPAGSHVPSAEEWEALITTAGGTLVAGKLKEAGTVHWADPNTGAESAYSFDALPGGYLQDGVFSGTVTTAVFITSSGSNGTTYFVVFNSDSGQAFIAPVLDNNTIFASVRLVNDTPCVGPYVGNDQLYNWYAATYSPDGASIAPSGWHVPTRAELATLRTYLGGNLVAGAALKEAGTTHWLTPNLGATNSSGFTLIPGGTRDSADGEYYLSDTFAMIWSATNHFTVEAYYGFSVYNGTQFDEGAVSKKNGLSIRLIKDNSTDPGAVTDIDGNVYPTVKIGDQVWMASNLKVTKYNDGTAIPEVTDNTSWAALTTGARCWYNNTPE